MHCTKYTFRNIRMDCTQYTFRNIYACTVHNIHLEIYACTLHNIHSEKYNQMLIAANAVFSIHRRSEKFSVYTFTIINSSA